VGLGLGHRSGERLGPGKLAPQPAQPVLEPGASAPDLLPLGLQGGEPLTPLVPLLDVEEHGIEIRHAGRSGRGRMNLSAESPGGAAGGEQV